MFHLQPGTGVGFSGSREMALGLGGELGVIIPPVPPVPPPVGGGSVSAPGGGFVPYIHKIPPLGDPIPDEWLDDEEEILIALCAIFIELME